MQKLIALLMLLAFASCTSTRTSNQNLKPATVLEVTTHTGRSGVSGVPSLAFGTHLALIGSQVGGGVAAHVIGATVGALIGAGAGYAAESNGSRIITLYVKLDSGMKATLAVSKLKHLIKPGDRVWVECDRVGIPLKFVESRVIAQ